MELAFEHEKSLINKILVVVTLTIDNRTRGGDRKVEEYFRSGVEVR